MEFDNSRPIFLQIADEFKQMIASGKVKPGSKVSSVRELSSEMSVNPNTVQKSLSFLEQQGLMYTERTSGRYITSDENVIMSLKEELLNGYVNQFISAISALGCDKAGALKLITDFLKDKEEN